MRLEARDILRQERIEPDDLEKEERIREIRREVVAKPIQLCLNRLMDDSHPLTGGEIGSIGRLVLRLNGFVNGDLVTDMLGDPDDATIEAVQKAQSYAFKASGENGLKKLASIDHHEDETTIDKLANKTRILFAKSTGGKSSSADLTRLRNARVAAKARVNRKKIACGQEGPK